MIVPNGSLYAYLVQYTDLRRKLNAMNGIEPGTPYVCFEDYVAQRGATYAQEPVTSEERKYVREVIRRAGGLRRFPIKQCYGNSQILLSHDFDHRFTYVEGFALSLFPFLHGWIDLDGKVIDVTLRQDREGGGRLSNRVLGTWSDQREYHGVHFDRAYVLKKILDRGFAGTLIDDYWAGHPLLTGNVVAHVAVAPHADQLSAKQYLDTLPESGQL